jgi:hypothetical protein
MVIDKTDGSVGNERVQEFAPLTKGEALASWSLKVRPFVNDDRR